MATKAKSRKAASSAGDQPVLSAAPDTTQFTGQFVEVVSGKHEGLRGAILQATKRDKNGVDKEGILRTRDDDNQRVVVAYKDLKIVEPGQRR